MCPHTHTHAMNLGGYVIANCAGGISSLSCGLDEVHSVCTSMLESQFSVNCPISLHRVSTCTYTSL